MTRTTWSQAISLTALSLTVGSAVGLCIAGVRSAMRSEAVAAMRTAFKISDALEKLPLNDACNVATELVARSAPGTSVTIYPICRNGHGVVVVSTSDDKTLAMYTAPRDLVAVALPQGAHKESPERLVEILAESGVRIPAGVEPWNVRRPA